MSKVIVDGVEWQEFLVEFQTQEGTFDFKLFAVDWSHAIDRLEELKATAKVIGDNCSDVSATSVQEPVAWGVHDQIALNKAIANYPAPAAPVQEPYGQVTVVKRPGCVDQHWFYRWPEPPYLDNAAECHVVYTTPPAQPTPDLQAELDATNRQVEILSDALAESRREVAVKDEALKLALEALEGVVKNCWRDIPSWRLDEIKERITAIKQARSAPVQEPDELKHIGEQDSLLDVDESAWHLLVENRGGCRCHISPPCSACSNPISEEEMNEVGYTYSTPPAAQRPWVGLTNEEIAQIYLVNTDKPLKPEWLFARAIERKLKEKNT